MHTRRLLPLPKLHASGFKLDLRGHASQRPPQHVTIQQEHYCFGNGRRAAVSLNQRNESSLGQCTRLPVETLFENLADGQTLDYYLETFPSVTRAQVLGVLRYGQRRIELELAA